MKWCAIRSWRFWRGQLIVGTIGALIGWWLFSFIEPNVNASLLSTLGAISGLSGVLVFLADTQGRLIESDGINYHARRELKEHLNSLLEESSCRNSLATGLGMLALVAGLLLESEIVLNFYSWSLAAGYASLAIAYLNVFLLLRIRRWVQILDLELVQAEAIARRKKERDLHDMHLEKLPF